jgi:hypothetical protein
VFVAAVYLPDVGRGFVKDDFGWIEAGRAALASPLRAFAPDAPGFFRPAVAFTFAGDYVLHGIHPRGYGFTNLALYLACAGALWILCRTLDLTPCGAAAATLAWAVNPHGINMAVVWISGRTSLCLTLFAILAAIAFVRRRYFWSACALAAALISKEEAVALPFVLYAWHLTLRARESRGSPWPVLASVAIPVVCYAVVRMQTDAFTPAAAPPYYRFSHDPLVLLGNLAEYVDRGATIAAIVVGVAAGVCRVAPTVGTRGRVAIAGAVWFAGGFALTAFLPIRSSLYAVFPSVGAALAAGVIVDAILAARAQDGRSGLRVAVALATALLAAVPIYRARNGRYVEPARLSERALRTIGREARLMAHAGTIVLHDVDDPTSNFVGAFGTFASNAVRLHAARDVEVWIDPPPGDWRLAGLHPPAAGDVVAEFAVDRGRVFRVQY